MQLSSLTSLASKAWRNQFKELRNYWGVYGGARALATSPYLHISLILAVFMMAFQKEGTDIAATTISVIPNLLGFTVGAMAITLAFSSSHIFKEIAQDGRPDSLFVTTVANFLHFIAIQTLALVSAILLSTTGFSIFKFTTSVLIFYGLSIVFSTGIQLFSLARIYNAVASIPSSDRVVDGQLPSNQGHNPTNPAPP